MRRKGLLGVAAVLVLLLVLTTVPARAGHNPAAVSIEIDECGVTLVATITDPEGTHLVGNMRLVAHVVGGDTEFTDVIPIDGDAVSITVGPFFAPSTATIMWRVFGGGERDYDSPLWNGYGELDFAAQINAYAAEVGSFAWVVAGPDDPNPFTTWHQFDVDGCNPTKEMCKGGGWEELGFEKNQGRCIRFVNTGKGG